METPTGIPGCVVTRHPVHQDLRGTFAKPFSAPAFTARGRTATWAECFYSRSHRGAVRGFHVQLPPAAHDKLVVCLAGAAFDAVLDLRVGSPTERRTAEVTLRAGDGQALYVPAGVAHAFQALEDDTVLLYLTGRPHDPERDAGVRWDGAGVTWPLPVSAVSPRDAALPTLADFVSPFTAAP